MTGRAVEYRQQIAAHAPARTRLRPGQSQYGGIQVLMSYQRPADARPVVAFPGRHTWSAQKQRHTNALLVEEAFVPDAVIAQIVTMIGGEDEYGILEIGRAHV